MYATFFGLKQPPFSIAPDPRYLFMSERHREALAHLLYGVGGGGGFVLLSGEIGAGKTTVCRCFLEQVPPGTQVAYIFNPRLTATELLQSVCDEFGLAVPAPAAAAAPTVKPYVDALNRHLLDAHAQGRQCVLVIDEAQNLAPEVLEQLRLLTNLETAERKLLQIILIGQPELRALLAAPGLEQLAQRVIARYHLGPLGGDETAAYVGHRLAVAGLAGPSPFDAAALRRVQALTGGVPRRINLLCDRALLGAYAQGRPRVDRRTVDRAAREVFDGAAAPAAAGRRRGLLLGAGAGALVGALVATAWWTLPRPAGVTVSAGAAAARAPASAVAATPARAADSAAAAGSSPATPAGPVTATPTAANAALPQAAAAPVLLASAAGAAVRVAAPAGSAPAPPTTGPVAAAPAGGPAPVAAPAGAAWPPRLDLPGGLAAYPGDERAAWRELMRLWALPEPDGGTEPCAAVRAQGWRCFRTASLSLAQLRALARPGVLVLRGPDGQARHARLAGLGADRLLLAGGGRAHTLGDAELARWWRGEFATLWQPPPGYTRLLEPGARGPAVDTLARALAALRQAPPPPAGQVLAGPLATALADFQRGQGWRADGVAGPATFMLIERAQGRPVPGLAAEPPER